MRQSQAIWPIAPLGDNRCFLTQGPSLLIVSIAISVQLLCLLSQIFDFWLFRISSGGLLGLGLGLTLPLLFLTGVSLTSSSTAGRARLIRDGPLVGGVGGIRGGAAFAVLLVVRRVGGGGGGDAIMVRFPGCDSIRGLGYLGMFLHVRMPRFHTISSLAQWFGLDALKRGLCGTIRCTR
jgi:hypothetical protein